MVQYPDTLKVKSSNWSPNAVDPEEQKTEVTYRGRWETTMKVRQGFMEQDVSIKGVFFTPLTTPEIPRGTTVEIINRLGVTVDADTVKKFKLQQFNSQIGI